MPSSVDILIMAAGSGKRFGRRKQFLQLGKSTVLGETVGLFKNIREVKKIIVVYPSDMSEEEVKRKGMIENVTLIKGGIQREDSVRNGLGEVNSEYVLIHDAARPACGVNLIKRVIEATLKYDAAVPGVNPSSTVKYSDGEKLRTLDRSRVYLVQTPQGFRASKIKEAYNAVTGRFTDSSSVAESSGFDVKIIQGEKDNIKITTPEDYCYLKMKLGIRNETNMNFQFTKGDENN